MFSSLESTLKADLAALLKLVNLMSTNPPPIRIGVQGGEKGFCSGISKGFDTCSSKDPSNGKNFRKVIITHTTTSLPTSMKTSLATMTSKPITKGIFTGSYTSGSSSKPPSSTEEKKGKGNRINTDPTEEEK